MTKYFYWVFLLIILLGCTNDEPISSERGFAEEKISYYNGSEQFNYDREITSKPNPILEFLAQVIRGIAWFLNTIFGYMMIVALVILLIWILFRHINQERISYNENHQTLRIVDESKIDEIDFGKLISKALASSNYRLAIRYTFLNTLKGLSLSKLIIVKDGKTNYEYYHELPIELKAKYRQVLSVFEYVWYGEFDSTSAIYGQIDANAKELQELINKSDA